jgi:metabotropic glutamate receptor 6/7/8
MSLVFTVDAVYAMAHALHNLIVDVCGKEGKICSSITPAPSGIDLLKYIRNVSFTSKLEFK